MRFVFFTPLRKEAKTVVAVFRYFVVFFIEQETQIKDFNEKDFSMLLAHLKFLASVQQHCIRLTAGIFKAWLPAMFKANKFRAVKLKIVYLLFLN